MDEVLDGPSAESIVSEFGLEPSKYFSSEEDQGEEAELEEGQSQEGEEEQQESEGQEGEEETGEDAPSEEENSILDQINALGAERNGEKISVGSLDEVKNAIQMAKDYTAKTQALSEERKSFESERETVSNELNAAIEEFNKGRAELEQQMQDYQQWQFTLNHMKESDPDLFHDVESAFKGMSQHFKNPVIESQLAAIRKEQEALRSQLSQREDKLILDEFASEQKQMAATEQALKDLGINVDWDAVKKEWASTGLPVKKVIGAMYFDSIAKAQASKVKVETVKKKVSARPTGAGVKSRPGSSAPRVTGTKDYFAMAQELYNNIK